MMRPCILSSFIFSTHSLSRLVILNSAFDCEHNENSDTLLSYKNACLLARLLTHSITIYLMLVKYLKRQRVVEGRFTIHFDILFIEFGWRWNPYTAISFAVLVSTFRSRVQLSLEILPFYVHFVCTFLSCWKTNQIMEGVRQKNVVYLIFRLPILTFR